MSFENKIAYMITEKGTLLAWVLMQYVEDKRYMEEEDTNSATFIHFMWLY